MSDTSGTVASLNRSDGGVPKLPVTAARVTAAGMEGDRQRNLKHHGGPDRALCLYALELIEALRAEGHPIRPGSVGENVTVRGIPWRHVVPGARLTIGDALVEITAYAVPCHIIRPSFSDQYSGRISQRTDPGWSRVYARVLRDAVLQVGDPVAITAERAGEQERMLCTDRGGVREDLAKDAHALGVVDVQRDQRGGVGSVPGRVERGGDWHVSPEFGPPDFGAAPPQH